MVHKKVERQGSEKRPTISIYVRGLWMTPNLGENQIREVLFLIQPLLNSQY